VPNNKKPSINQHEKAYVLGAIHLLHPYGRGKESHEHNLFHNIYMV